MIRRGAQATGFQTLGGVFHLGAAITVDNAAFAALLLHIAQQLLGRFEFFHQRVANIGAVKAAQMQIVIGERQMAHDILAGGVIGGGSQRHHWQLWKALFDLAECTVFWAKIVSPLRDTVRLIHRQQRERPLRQLLLQAAG